LVGVIALAMIVTSAGTMAAPASAEPRDTGFEQPYLGPPQYAHLSAPKATFDAQINMPLGQRRADALARKLGFPKNMALTKRQLRLMLTGGGIGGGTPETRRSGKIIVDSIRYLTNTLGSEYSRVVDGELTAIRLASYGLIVTPEGVLESPGHDGSPARTFNYLLLPQSLCDKEEIKSTIPPGIQCGYVNQFMLKNGAADSLRALYASAFTSFVPFGPAAQSASEPDELAPNSKDGTPSLVGISMPPPLWLINFVLTYSASPELAANFPAYWTPIPTPVADALVSSETGQVLFSDYQEYFPDLPRFEIPRSASAGENGPTIAPILKRDIVIGADMWDTTPRIMSLTLNFDGIIGIPNSDDTDFEIARAAVVAAGGAWNTITQCSSPPTTISHTTALSPEQYYAGSGVRGEFLDVVQVQTSWPVRPSTLDGTDFKVTLNNGSIAKAVSATVIPNFEYNERSVLILNGEFGNRLPKNDPDVRYPVKVEIVKDSTPLQLVGPRGTLVSAVGMSITNDVTPYDDQSSNPTEWTGPRSIAAKMTRMSTRGESGPVPLKQGLLPNDGVSMFGKNKAKFRMRMLTSGGAFSPDGIFGLHPGDYRKHFRLVGIENDGTRVPLTEQGKTYRIDGYPIRIEGLADLGLKQDTYDQCYREDSENHIDIILSGSEKAAERIKILEIPAQGDGYSPLYNDGGPGNNPTPGVRFTAPSPRHSLAIMNGLRDPMRVTFRAKTYQMSKAAGALLER